MCVRAFHYRPLTPACVQLDRLEHACDPWVEQWLAHQPRDAFWAHGSICEDPSRIPATCGLLLIGGWADPYHNAVLRMISGGALPCPVRAMLGPWSHEWPDIAAPGPTIGYVQECIRWFDYYLRGRTDNGAMDAPLLRAFVKDSVAPATQCPPVWPGRWVSEAEWPPVGPGRVRRYALGVGVLLPLVVGVSDATGMTDRVPSPRPVDVPISNSTRVGARAGSWLSFGEASLPGDQRADDAFATCFDSPPLTSAVEVRRVAAACTFANAFRRVREE